jgi:hypothetical protein
MLVRFRSTSTARALATPFLSLPNTPEVCTALPIPWLVAWLVALAGVAPGHATACAARRRCNSGMLLVVSSIVPWAMGHQVLRSYGRTTAHRQVDAKNLPGSCQELPGSCARDLVRNAIHTFIVVGLHVTSCTGGRVMAPRAGQKYGLLFTLWAGAKFPLPLDHVGTDKAANTVASLPPSPLSDDDLFFILCE